MAGSGRKFEFTTKLSLPKFHAVRRSLSLLGKRNLCMKLGKALCLMMFSDTVLLCPTTYDCVSPEYLSAFEGPPEEIASYDWSSVVFRKLSSSIDIFIKNDFSGALCGCLLVHLVRSSSV